jgi:hypothetical protein
MNDNFMGNITFYNESMSNTSHFKWFKGQYEIDKQNNISIMSDLNEEKIKIFKPNIENVIIDMANLDLSDNNKILEFVNNYGLLGLISFYENHPYKKDISINFGIEKTLYPYIHITDNPNNPHLFNYHEPIEYFKRAISDFQHSCWIIANNFHKQNDVFDNNMIVQPKNIDRQKFVSDLWKQELRWYENYNKTNMTLINKKGKPTFAVSVNSLLDYAYSKLALNVGNGKILKICESFYKRTGNMCGNFYWRNGKQKYCSKTCAERATKQERREKQKIRRISNNGK